MENNIPTAEEFFIQTQKEKGLWRDYDADSVAADYIQQFAINFAKLHAEAQRECVEEEVSKTDLNTGRQASIINAYPLTNIK